MFSAATVTSSPYNPQNQEHRQLILNQIKAMEEKYAALLWADICVAPSLLAVGGWALGQVSLILLAAFAGLQANAYVNQPYSRNKLAADYQANLKKLLELYRWCGKNGAAISHDETFLAMLKTLSPFIAAKDLLLWENGNVSQSDLSAKYMEILAAPPHQIQFVLAKNNSEPGMLEWMTGGYFFSSKKEVKKEDTRMAPTDSWQTSFQRPKASAKYFWYGYQDESARSMLGEGMSFIQTTLGFKQA